MRALAILSVVAFTLGVAGCGGTDTKEDRPDPVVSRQPQDPPPAEEQAASPPMGKPRSKVAPITTDEHRKESLLREDPPH